MPPAERALHASLPAWIIVAFAMAVFGDTLGSVFLLLRKRWATPVFAVSFVFTLAQMIYTLFISKVIVVQRATSAIFPVIILLVGVF